MGEPAIGTGELQVNPGPACPSCLQWGVLTPVEKWREAPMKYCTFHYWMMRGRLSPCGFAFDAYAERSRAFGFVLSLPPPTVMEEMARDWEAQVEAPPELGHGLRPATSCSGEMSDSRNTLGLLVYARGT